jgi:hypothetical protein
MWWWQFNGEEPLQEDLVVFEKLMDMRRARRDADREKQRQKDEIAAQKASARGGTSKIKGASYTIPDPSY